MKLIPLTDAQASFVEVEILGRYLDDDELTGHERAVIDIVLDHFERSRGKSLAVPDAEFLSSLVLDAINAIDDAIENEKKGRVRDGIALIGGVDTVQQARGVHKAGEALLRKLHRA